MAEDNYVTHEAVHCKPMRPSSTSPSIAKITQPRGAFDRHYSLEFDDGSSLDVRGRGVIGREPKAPTGAQFRHVVALADPTLTLSRTHLEFGVGDSGLWVRDCASTNGSQLEISGNRTQLQPKVAVLAPNGCTIHVGGRRVRVQKMTKCAVIGAATLQWGAAIDIGSVHTTTQDGYCTDPPVFVVADGIGGHAAGDVASREAIGALKPLTGKSQVTRENLQERLAEAQTRVDAIAVENGRPPGTTLSGVIATETADGPSWLVVNIGDSRTYRLSSDGFEQLTTDHSLAQDLVNRGAVTPAAAKSLPVGNALTRALIQGSDHTADVSELPMGAGDRILVCSDGLPKALDDQAIAEVLGRIADPQAAADELVAAVVQGGAHDDVTVLVVDVVALDSTPSA